MTEEPPSRRRTRLALSTLLGTMGTLHVVVPRPFERMIPGWLPGDRAAWNAAATVAELGSAALLASRPTSRAGGYAALGTFATVYVANVQAALDGGMRGLPGWLGSAQAAWLRLPLQAPLLWAAWRVARR